MVILFSTKCFLFVYMNIDLLNFDLKPVNYLKIVVLTSPGFFKRSQPVFPTPVLFSAVHFQENLKWEIRHVSEKTILQIFFFSSSITLESEVPCQ